MIHWLITGPFLWTENRVAIYNAYMCFHDTSKDALIKKTAGNPVISLLPERFLPAGTLPSPASLNISPAKWLPLPSYSQSSTKYGQITLSSTNVELFLLYICKPEVSRDTGQFHSCFTHPRIKNTAPRLQRPPWTTQALFLSTTGKCILSRLGSIAN